MKKYSILLAAAAIIAAASCAKEALAPEENAAGEKEQTVTEQTLTNPVTITFTANATQTKVSLEGEGTAGSKTAVWDDGDQVKIIWYNTVESTMKSKNATVDSYGPPRNSPSTPSPLSSNSPLTAAPWQIRIRFTSGP